MAKVYENVHLYDGLDSEVAVAPKGSTLPEGIGASADPFVEVGWISEDGIEEEVDASDESVRAFQGRKIVKRFIPEAEVSFTFQCLEENAVVHGLKTRGAAVTVENGVAKTIRDRETALDERAWRIRLIADDLTEKVYVFVGMHTLGSVAHQSSEVTLHEYTIKPVGDVIEYTDNPSIVTAAGAGA